MRRRALGTTARVVTREILDAFSCTLYSYVRVRAAGLHTLSRDEDVDEATEIVASETSRDGATNLGARGRHAVREDV